VAWHDASVPPPFVAYLRVYEPLEAFDRKPRARLERALAAGALPPFLAGTREREVWLRTQLAVPPRMLPGDRADGTSSEGPLEVLSLEPAEVQGVNPDAGTLVCPLDLRARSALALIGFVATSSPLLARVALPAGGVDAVRSRSEAVVNELGAKPVHVVSATWTVPLPWFALVEPAARRVEPVPRPNVKRRVSWRAPIHDARERVARAHAIVQRNLGDSGPGRVLADTGRWLAQFHTDSVVELDYGGLVQLMDDDSMLADTSAQDVHAAVDALENGQADQVALHYERLRDFWLELAAFERFG